MGKDPVLTTLAFKREIEMDREKSATNEGFVRYEFNTAEVLGSEEALVQVRKWARSTVGSFKAVTFVAAPLFYRVIHGRPRIRAIFLWIRWVSWF